MSEKIGFVGLGRMGANMARCLHDKKFNVTAVYDVRPEVTADLAREIGATACSTLAQVTELADVIFTVVTDDKVQLQIFEAPDDNLLQGKPSGKVFVNCATVSPKTHVAVEGIVEKVGASSLEGCMASSIPQARQGTLYLMVGGKEAIFQKVKPILDALSTALTYVGGTGKAAQVKALVNMVMNINTLGLAEGLGLAHGLGLDLNMVREVFSQTGAASRVLQTDGEDMQNREHSCFFSAEHAAKDSGIALALARELGLHLALADATKCQYDRLVKLGAGQLDKSAISELTFLDRRAREIPE
ncbi:3-hydroxyisobutyrate dehydrogenase [Methylacidimicrobium cyclopophantes]|uniref:3-hydroxyisobutyrate dehydrogenase n=1 Tax=Methylacidimicrobium cyclopophantes TaxID=1041766 RepID=A0A5E6MGE6_9BACT|nr:NAD(P)-dependent oxidoreductase [Methylacidimicrobium cyclopophantes]VVM08558.1 3-hydroxyisobutyrate dehydrogenase [Methylacidimicrobium cyclopophantes]